MSVPSTPSDAGLPSLSELNTVQTLAIGIVTLSVVVLFLGLGVTTAVYLITLYVSLVVATKWRPDGGGQLLALGRWLAVDDGGALNPSVGVLAIEIVAICCFLVGLGGVVVFGLLDAGAGYGPYALAALVVAAALWLLAWLLEGLTLTASNPWREEG